VATIHAAVSSQCTWRVSVWARRPEPTLLTRPVTGAVVADAPVCWGGGASVADVEKFYDQCDPNQDNLCLYGQQDGSWEVALPVEEVPPELPEPALGINFARDGMNR
jgi:hypothetical protein